MKLQSFRIQNFRSCKDVHLSCEGMHAIVGSNNAGKSTILKALEFFLNASKAAIGEDFVTVCECGHGHRFRVTFPPLKQFELLGHAGVDAFIAGYFSETVMDLMAAVERAYEYFCQVVHYSKGMPFGTFDQAWKALGKLSERRLGWFAAMWLIETGRPYVLPDRQVRLRNDVVHNGEFPSRKQAAEFGDWAVGVLFDICEHLKGIHSEALTKHHFHYAAIRRERVMKRVSADPELNSLPEGGHSAPSVFGLNCCDFPRKSFAEVVEEVRKPRHSGINPKGVAPIRAYQTSITP